MDKDEEIAELEKRLAELKNPVVHTWPKRITMYVHGDKETSWQTGKDIGLSEPAADRFMYALYELTVEMSVDEDGTYEIVSCTE
jgi:hypothetical protein